MSDEPTFIVTLALDAPSFARLSAMRELYFPPERNFIPAHLTLLHRVAARQLDRLDAAWPALRELGPVSLRYAGVRLLGRGVAIGIESNALRTLRAKVMETMGDEFSRQDLQAFHPHVTVQNKVPPPDAAQLYERLSASFQKWNGYGEGLLIWRYLGGPWQHEGALEFVRPACLPSVTSGPACN